MLGRRGRLSVLVRGSRGERSRECVLDERPGFDEAVDQDLDALGALQVDEVTRAHRCGEPAGRLLPEFRLKHGAVLSASARAMRERRPFSPHERLPGATLPAPCCERGERRSRVRTIERVSRLVFSYADQDKGRRAIEQTMNPHVLLEKNSTIRNIAVT